MDETAIYTLITPQNLVGLGLIILGAYSWWSKLNTERTVGSDFKELIENLQGQLSDLKEDLRNEREFRQKAEQEKNEALSQVGSLTLEVQTLRTQVQQLQSSIDALKDREQVLMEKLINK